LIAGDARRATVGKRTNITVSNKTVNGA